MKWAKEFMVRERRIALDEPTWFIADIASSHDGDLGRAKELIWLAKEAGADCAKFQHFLAKDIVSDEGFKAMGSQSAHQSAWKESVYEVFEKYQTPREWTDALVAECSKAGIEYMTTPYDVEALDLMQDVVPAWKVGSGDIGWTQYLANIAGRGKPVFLATGAADISDVKRAVDAILAETPDLCLMQCNTNYTGELSNFHYVNLNVLKTFATEWPGMVLGLSDHTPGHAAVLGAVALGARAVEKHFTDDNNREGPDHGFSMNPLSWREMVDRTRELEAALGDGVKRVEENETASAIVQRRCLRARINLPKGHVLREEDLEALRPKPENSVEPWQMDMVVGKPLPRDFAKGDTLMQEDFQ